ncbi:MAG: glycosyl hydrolase family 67 [Chitinivibrionales bacterium]|nr:glycosyl hydrolase family 67 [Chitinivibrionales bacterium]
MEPRQDFKLYIIDANAPLFNTRFSKNRTVNWSKAPFEHLERGGTIDKSVSTRVLQEYKNYVEQVALLGYNAISLDDVAHLVSIDFYPQKLRNTISDYKAFYSKFFDIASRLNLKIFLTTDIMFYNNYIDTYTRNKDSHNIHLLSIALKRLFKEFPQVNGVIFRIGESDGIDVHGEFNSRLIIKRPAQARRYIQSLLPVFESYNRLLIFRTWTLGAYPIGDLMWNPDTYHAVFDKITSKNFVISLKYGDTDFHRHLHLSPLFFESSHKKIIELQTRREYEGFGEFPSFVGFDYEKYYSQLSSCNSLIGIYAWCQTGGWSRFTRLSFQNKSSLWNELNTNAAIDIFRCGKSAEKAVEDFASRYFPDNDPSLLLRLVKLSDIVVKDLWYLPEYSRRTLYFRRIRIPPLFWVFWDTIIINHFVRKILRRFVHNRDEAIKEGYRALYKIKEIRRLGMQLGMDEQMFDFYFDTFEILALAREYFLGPWSPGLNIKIEKIIEHYERKYPSGFKIEKDFSPLTIRSFIIKAVFRMCLRPHAHYRPIDKFFLIKFTGWFYPLIKNIQHHRFPEFADKQAMGTQVLFK